MSIFETVFKDKKWDIYLKLKWIAAALSVHY